MRTLVLVVLLLVPALPFPEAQAGLALDWREALAAAEDGRLVLPDGTVLRIGRHDVRADGFAVVVQDGTGIDRLDVPAHTWAGVVEDRPGSFARVSISPHGVFAAWQVPGAPLRSLAPVHGDRHAVTEDAGTPIDDGGIPAPDTAAAAADVPGLASGRAARVMIDVDETFWRTHGCVASTTPPPGCTVQSDRWAIIAEHIVSVVDAMFVRQTGVSLEVTELHAWRSTAAPYPYRVWPVIDVAEALDEARTYWESTRPTTSDPRDLLHLISGRTQEGNFIGYAYVGAVESRFAYGVSVVPTLNTRPFPLVAHEIGHNFAAVHDETSSPLLGAAANAGARTFQRTIMASTICTCADFSDGSVQGDTNSVARIRAHAADRVVGP